MAVLVRRIAVIAATVAALAVLVPAQADAQEGGSATLTCTPTTVEVGGDLTCTLGEPAPYADGCVPGSTVEFFVNDIPWASGVVQSPVTVTAPLPPGVGPGAVEVTATCGGAVLSTSITVVASTAQAAPVRPVSAPSTTSLPVTGGDSISWVQVALVLIAVGLLLVVATRKRASEGDAAAT